MTKKIQSSIDVLQEAIYFRSWRTERHYRNAFFMQEMFSKTGEMLELENNDDIFYLSIAEIIEALEKNELIPNEMIVQRRKGYACFAFENQVRIFSGEDLEMAKGEISLFDFSKNAVEIKGQSSYPGKVKGIVSVVLDKKDLENIKEGSILVSPSTTIDYVPALKKVIAIVTEEGGVLSHASVISREFKIPCIIGTKFATQVLHDGDLVEVDADNGVVRILERVDEIKQIVLGQNGLTLISVNKNTPEDKRQVVKLVKETDWDVQKFNAYPFFTSSVATFSGFKLPWGLSYKHFLCVSHNKNVQWHYDKSDFERIGNIFWEKVTSIEILEDLIAQYERTYTDSVQDARYFKNNLQKSSIDELKNLLKKQVNLLCFSVGYAHITECASFVAEKYFQEKYQMEVKNVRASKQSFINKAANYAKKLCDSKMNDEEILKEFKKKYAWIQSSYLGRNELDIKAVRNFAENFQEEAMYVEDKNNVFAGMLARLISWHDERKENILKSVYQSDPVLMALAEKVGISQKTIGFMLPEEIDKIEDKNFQAELLERSKIFVDYAPSTLERTLFVGDEAQKILHELENKVSVHEQEFKGSVAFPGIVQGIAKICLSMESIENFEEGEILIASMTRPEYISAMKKAKAIITDEGGVTCHAAIIARELKIPCIIGTKIATQVLHDGDLVEVDANKGVVRILKRAEN